jgi:hypothetical protein
MINVLDTQRSEQILYTYRQLYRNFSAVFEELVPAGRAELLLTGCPEGDSDEGRLEAATGLSTAVTFTGEAAHRRNLEQLSGGQKTLVALAFILAIQRCDPAPFYLFDEVDAALDADHRFGDLGFGIKLLHFPVQGGDRLRDPRPGQHGTVHHHDLPAGAPQPRRQALRRLLPGQGQPCDGGGEGGGRQICGDRRGGLKEG